MSDEKLIDAATRYLGDGTTVLAAGMFQPRGTSGGMAGATSAGFATDTLVGEVAGAAAAVESGRAMAEVRGVPRWTMLAVTDATLVAIACGQHGVGWQPESTFATFDRSAIRVRVHGRVNVRTLSVDDPTSGKTFEWEGFRFGPSHANAVLDALDAEEVEPPED